MGDSTDDTAGVLGDTVASCRGHRVSSTVLTPRRIVTIVWVRDVLANAAWI